MASYSTGSLPVSTTDSYPDLSTAGAAALSCQGATAGTITVSVAAVTLQYGHAPLAGTPTWEAAEHFYPPGVWQFTSRDGLDAIRCRSAKAGTPATVAISAYV